MKIIRVNPAKRFSKDFVGSIIIITYLIRHKFDILNECFFLVGDKYVPNRTGGTNKSISP